MSTNRRQPHGWCQILTSVKSSLMSANRQQRYEWYQLLTFCILGFVSGLPFALVTTTFQAWLTTSNVPIETIGAFGLVSLPYALKPLWAVGIDWLRAATPIGNRSVYLCAVVLLSMALYGMSAYQNHAHNGLVVLVVVGCFASATIDICVDAIRIISIDTSMQGSVSAWFVVFYRVAFIISGGMALVIVDHIGWQGLYHWMSLLMLTFGIMGYLLTLGLKMPQGKSRHKQHAFFSSILTWIRHHYAQITATLGFIFAYKFHGCFLASLLQVYLINEAKMSLSFLGYTYKTGGMLATFLGGIIGGSLTRYTSVKRGVQLTILLQLIATSLFICIHATQTPSEHPWLISIAMVMESLSLGTSTTMITIMITKNCQKQLAATQYAFFTAAIAWQRSLVTPLAASIQTQSGWQGYFMSSLILIPVILWLLEKERHAFAQASSATHAAVN